jgi:hypothetical protein
MAKKTVTNLQDVQINVKLKLAALWATLMFLYVYADVLSFFRPGQLDEIMAGKMGPLEVSQATLLVASLVVIIPALMIFFSVALGAKLNRRINIIAGILFTLVNIGNLIGEGWAYYILFGILEILTTLLIIRYAFRWPADKDHEFEQS